MVPHIFERKKEVYFQILMFEGKVPVTCTFFDKGYTISLEESTRQCLRTYGIDPTDQALEALGIPMIVLKHNQGGLFIPVSMTNGRKDGIIFYNQLYPSPNDIFNRAHEEAHAAVFLGLGKGLERLLGSSYNSLHEEDFCDSAGRHALHIRGIDVPSECATPYEERLKIAAHMVSLKQSLSNS